MELNPTYIKENLHKIGIKEASALLKEWIISSNILELRKDALELFGSLDDGKNFKFLEQVFLSDEDLEIRLIAGKILEHNYMNHKKLIPLLEYSLKKIKEFEQKFLVVEFLNRIDTSASRKILKNFLKTYIKEKLGRKLQEFPEEIFTKDYQFALPSQILDICFNLILYDFYTYECRYNISLRKGLIILLNCEGANLNSIKEIAALHRLSHLEHLLLHRNNIEKINGLDDLKKLKVLDLSNNTIETIENLEGLPFLEELNLSQNKIETIANLNSLKDLKKLNLASNLITEIKGLESLRSLEDLNLNKNKIMEIKNISHLLNLKRLSISFNQITSISQIGALENLIWLNLNDNKISQIHGLDGMHNLKVLNLTNNLITKIENLENLENLERLELSNNKIQEIRGLESLLKLNSLYLNDNKIKIMEGIDYLDNLIILNIENNQISEYNDTYKEKLKKLYYIYLSGNPLTPKSWICYKKHMTRYP